MGRPAREASTACPQAAAAWARPTSCRMRKGAPSICVLGVLTAAAISRRRWIALYREYEGGGFYVALPNTRFADQGFRMGDEKRRRGAASRGVSSSAPTGAGRSGRRLRRRTSTDDQQVLRHATHVPESRRASSCAKLPARLRHQLRPHARTSWSKVRPARRATLRRGKVRDRNHGRRFGRASPIASSASSAGARRTATAFTPSCTASVVLSLDPATGEGTVLYSAPTAVGVRVRARKQRLQGRPALPDAARPQVTTAQRACRKVRL